MIQLLCLLGCILVSLETDMTYKSDMFDGRHFSSEFNKLISLLDVLISLHPRVWELSDNTRHLPCLPVYIYDLWGIISKWNEMKWNEWDVLCHLYTCTLNFARRTSWGWWDKWDDTAIQTLLVTEAPHDIKSLRVKKHFVFMKLEGQNGARTHECPGHLVGLR